MSNRKITILLVEDTEIGVARFKKMLTIDGCEIHIVVAANHRCVFPTMERMGQVGRSPDCVVTGLYLDSTEEEGLTVIRALRKSGFQKPIVVWSKSADRYRDAATTAGATIVYRKYSPEEEKMPSRILALIP